MTSVKSLLWILAAGLVFFSFRKDNGAEAVSAGSFTGKWTGKYGFGNEAPSKSFSLQIKSDGTIRELNSSGVVRGRGTWKMERSVLKGNYKMLFAPYSEYSISANLDPGRLEGTWGYDDNGTGGGKISLFRD
jgi:hypothetical protein